MAWPLLLSLLTGDAPERGQLYLTAGAVAGRLEGWFLSRFLTDGMPFEEVERILGAGEIERADPHCDAPPQVVRYENLGLTVILIGLPGESPGVRAIIRRPLFERGGR
jgi:hypothetical protein